MKCLMGREHGLKGRDKSTENERLRRREFEDLLAGRSDRRFEHDLPGPMWCFGKVKASRLLVAPTTEIRALFSGH
jgi:hypothetical protein